ncbi:MAG: PAS domain S-box protein, partial [Phycisphaerae bacterium]|nr:PAS domain S-box protein [Phycisphaerae bacterium]
MVIRSYLGPVVNIADMPFLFAALTVAASSWFGGWGPGVIHALLLIGIVQYFLVLPERGLEYVLSDTQIIRMSFFGLQCIVLSVIIDRLVKSRQAVQFRIAHQDVELALRDAVLRSTGSRAGDAEAISNILRALVRELECEAGIAWSVNGTVTAVASVASGSMKGDGERPSPREQRRHARAEAFVLRRVADGVIGDDLVRRCAREGAPIAGQHAGEDRLVQHALALPVTGGEDRTGSHFYVFELRRAVTFAPTPEALKLFESLVNDIEQCRRLRSTERTVDVLNRRLLDRAQELETVLEAAPIGLAVSRSTACDDVRINASAAECLALPRGTRHLTSEDRHPAFEAALRICSAPMTSATDRRRPVGPVELEFDDVDGQMRTIYASASPLVDAEGNVRGCVAALVDITQIRRAELAIREREKAFRRSFECAGVGKAEIDPSTGCFQLVNRRLCEMFAATAADLTGRPFVELLAAHERPRAESMLESVLRSEQGAMTEEFEFVTQDGKPVFGATSITADYDVRGRATHLIAVIQDVTGRRQAEEELSRYRARLEDLVQARTAALEGTHRQLRISERMAALGTMSAGLGHDMGNLLLPVRLRLESMALKGIPFELQDDVQAIGKCAEYLQRLANGLRLLSLDPDQAHLTEHTDLDRWWADIETFLRNTLPRGAELEKRFEQNLPLLPVSRHRLTQAVFNLVQNASDAVRDQGNGRVCVAASRTADGAGLCLVVED